MCLNPIGSCIKCRDEDASAREPSPEPDHLQVQKIQYVREMLEKEGIHLSSPSST